MLYIQSKTWVEHKDSKECLYRFYTWGDFHDLCQKLWELYYSYFSMQHYIRHMKEKLGLQPIEILVAKFGSIKGIPNNTTSACKKLNMFLRWMIRKNSPVDLGIWSALEPSSLIIPLDTHVHKQALNMGITKRKQADMKTAKEITKYFADIFPGDPARGDFALFGYGINNK